MTRLGDAALNGKLENVKEFIQAGDNINEQDEVYQIMILSFIYFKQTIQLCYIYILM